jgi:hypothetical protein
VLRIRASSFAFFVALLASAVMLAPALMHVFELPAKMHLPRDEYFVVQRLKSDWYGFPLLLAVQFGALFVAAFLSRRRTRVLIPTLLAILFVATAQALFWAYAYPANVATANWTAPSDNWIALRRQWEVSQAAGAGAQLLAMACLAAAVVMRLPARKRRYYYY